MVRNAGPGAVSGLGETPGEIAGQRVLTAEEMADAGDIDPQAVITFDIARRTIAPGRVGQVIEAGLIALRLSRPGHQRWNELG